MQSVHGFYGEIEYNYPDKPILALIKLQRVMFEESSGIQLPHTCNYGQTE